MKRDQAVRFWRELRDSTETEPILRKYTNKPGYAGRRTLQRYVQADSAFREAATDQETTRKTGWSICYVAKIRAWWKDEFCRPARPAPPPTPSDPVDIRRHRRCLRSKVEDLFSQLSIHRSRWLGSWVPSWAEKYRGERLWVRKDALGDVLWDKQGKRI